MKEEQSISDVLHMQKTGSSTGKFDLSNVGPTDLEILSDLLPFLVSFTDSFEKIGENIADYEYGDEVSLLVDHLRPLLTDGH